MLPVKAYQSRGMASRTKQVRIPELAEPKRNVSVSAMLYVDRSQTFAGERGGSIVAVFGPDANARAYIPLCWIVVVHPREFRA
jgi:hypothetical protein